MIRLVLPWPPSVNHYWRHNRGRTHISAEGRRYRHDVATILTTIRRDGETASGRLRVALELQPPDRRRRDLDNALKALLDALEHAGLYHDDSQIDRLELHRSERHPGGRVIVTVWPLTGRGAIHAP